MINILDKQIADKIAAGEVIERPVSIIKELVENSIDAGADSIVVEIRKGGKSYIRVSDNGCGMSAEDAEKAFLRHATSKISTAADLDAIETLGFRGEALASVCAVTRTELLTKRKEDKTGTNLILHGGQVISRRNHADNHRLVLQHAGQAEIHEKRFRGKQPDNRADLPDGSGL